MMKYISIYICRKIYLNGFKKYIFNKKSIIIQINKIVLQLQIKVL